MPGFSFLVTLIAGSLAWATMSVPQRVLAATLALAVALIVVGTGVGADLRGGEAALVLLFAVSGGALLGRLLPPRAMAMAVLLGVLSVLDIIWIASGGSAGDIPDDYANFTMRVGDVSGTLGTLDVLLAAAVAAHWQAR
jgi:hypothetical protein